MKPAVLATATATATAILLANLAPTSAEPVTAPDGAARGYERPPSDPTTPGGFLLDGVGQGAGYLVRALIFPFRATARLESKYELRRHAHELFWNDADTVGIFPVASYSTSNGPKVGIRGVYKDVLGHDEQLAVAADTGGIVNQSYQLTARAPRVAPGLALAARLRYDDHEGLRFHGIGNDPAQQLESRYSQERILAVLQARLTRGEPGGLVRLGASAIYDDRTFGGAPASGGSPDITMAYDTSTIPGFDDGSRNLELTFDAELDTRDTPGPTGAGGVVRVFGGAGALADEPFAHYGAELAYHITPFLPGRVLGARIALEGVDPLDGDGDGEVAFTDLPRLGGGRRLRGYTEGRFRDRLATVATLEYRYPVHALVSGELFVEAGKVAPTYDELAGDGLTRDWHTSMGGGFVVHTPSSIALRLDVAYGDGLQLFLGTDVLDAFRDRENEL